MTPAPSPQLLIKEINDTYAQGNFKSLREYFNKQNQLLNFNFIEFSFSGAVTNQKLAHGLGLVPQDVIITRITGTGIATLNWSLFDANNLDITTTGACRIRMFVGSYWNFQTLLGNLPADTEQVSSAPATTVINNITSTTTTSAAASTATAPPAGAIIAYGGLDSIPAPTGWLFCDGSTVSRITYAALFVNIGTTFGVGDGSTTFGLPDLRGRVIAGKDDMNLTTAQNRITSGVSGITGTTLAAVGGAQSVVLTASQIPSHSHNTTSCHAGGVYGGGTVIAGFTFAGTATQASNLTDVAGGGLFHTNVQPTMILNYLIKT